MTNPDNDITDVLDQTAADTAPRHALVDGIMRRIETVAAPERKSLWLSWPGLLKPALAPVLCVLVLSLVYFALPDQQSGQVASTPAQRRSSQSAEKAQDFDGHNEIGFIDRAGNIVIPPLYSGTSGPFSEGLVAVNLSDRGGDEKDRDGLWGYLDRNGNMVIEPRFEQAWGFEEGLAPVRANGRWGFIDTRGRFVIPPQFEQVFNFSDGLAPAKIGTKFGLIDRTGAFVLEPQFDTPGWFREGLAIVSHKQIIDASGNMDLVRSVIDRKGNVIIGPESGISALHVSEGLIAAQKGDYWGFVDRNAETIIPFIFKSTYSFKNGVGKVTVDAPGRQQALIDRTGKIIAGPVKHVDRGLRYDPVENRFYAGYYEPPDGRPNEEPFDFATMVPHPELYFDSNEYGDGLIHVRVGEGKDQRVGLVDLTGRFVIPPRFRFVGQFANGRANFSGDVLNATEAWRLINPAPADLIAQATPMQVADAGGVWDGGISHFSYIDVARHAAMRNARWGFFDKMGQVVIKPAWSQVHDFSEALALVKEPDVDNIPGRWLFIDKRGYTAITIPYDGARSFSEGRAAVCMGNKWGFIDRTGQLVVPFRYDAVEDYHEGKAIVTIGKKSGFIDASGQVIVEPIYDQARPFSEDLALVGILSATPWTHKFSILDTAGNLTPIAEPLYVIAPFSEGLALAQNTGRMWGYINTAGEVAIPFKFPGGFFGGFDKGRAWVKDTSHVTEDWYGYIDTTGNWVVEPVPLYNMGVVYMKDEHMVVGRWGDDPEHVQEEPVDLKRLWPVFDGVRSPLSVTKGGLRRIDVESRDGTKHAYMDANGKVAFTLAPGMDEPREFSEGLAAYAANVDWEAYDKTMESLGNNQW